MSRPKPTFTATPDGPVLDSASPAALRATARLLAAQQQAEFAIQHDLWQFATRCVQTIDPATGKTRMFPTFDYLRTLFAEWQQNPLFLCAKSRRMFVSWAMITAHYWLARTTPNAKIVFMARKEGRNEAEGSAELVWRAKFIHDHLPPWVQNRPIEYQFCRLRFPDTHSEIVGLGEGADQARQMTLTAIFGDEVAFWEDPLATYIALRPTIEGGGRLTLVSSAGPGFFEALVHDRLPQ